MKDLNKKTKDELIEMVEELEEKVSELENDVDYWLSEYNDMEKERDKLDEQLDDIDYDGVIKDIDNFISRLKIDNYDLFEKIEPFIENYLKFYNN